MILLFWAKLRICTIDTPEMALLLGLRGVMWQISKMAENYANKTEILK